RCAVSPTGSSKPGESCSDPVEYWATTSCWTSATASTRCWRTSNNTHSVWARANRSSPDSSSATAGTRAPPRNRTCICNFRIIPPCPSPQACPCDSPTWTTTANRRRECQRTENHSTPNHPRLPSGNQQRERQQEQQERAE